MGFCEVYGWMDEWMDEKRERKGKKMSRVRFGTGGVCTCVYACVVGRGNGGE